MKYLMRIMRGAAVAAGAVVFTSLGADPTPLESGFLNPLVQARPIVYWNWVTGNISREGITHDLEHMKRVGLGGRLLFDVPALRGGCAATASAGPVDFMSDEWLDLINFAAEEPYHKASFR